VTPDEVIELNRAAIFHGSDPALEVAAARLESVVYPVVNPVTFRV